jgi:hypothetical protein
MEEIVASLEPWTPTDQRKNLLDLAADEEQDPIRKLQLLI